MASRLLVASLLAASLTASGLALAEPSAADRDTARKLMAEGRQDRESNDLKGALKAFVAADALMHVPTTGLEVARTQAAMGLLVEARDTALRVSRMPEKPNDPPPFKQARDAATALNEDLDARIPSLTVTLSGVPDGATATVSVDKDVLPAEDVGQPRRLDPGHHVVVAKAGSAEGKAEIDLAEKDQKTVTVELSAGTPTTPTPTEGGGTTTGTPAAAETPSGKSGASTGMMIGGFAVAGAGVVVGTITGILSLSKTSSIKGSSGCQGTVCGPTEYSDISSAKSMATVSTVSFIVAGAGAVFGVIGLVTGNGSSPSATPEKTPTEENTSRIEPWFGLGSAGLRGSF